MWQPIFTSPPTLLEASVNSVAWAPHELGLMLAAASSDGSIAVISLGPAGALLPTLPFPLACYSNLQGMLPTNLFGSAAGRRLGDRQAGEGAPAGLHLRILGSSHAARGSRHAGRGGTAGQVIRQRRLR